MHAVRGRGPWDRHEATARRDSGGRWAGQSSPFPPLKKVLTRAAPPRLETTLGVKSCLHTRDQFLLGVRAQRDQKIKLKKSSEFCKLTKKIGKMPVRQTKAGFIESAKRVHQDKYDYSDVLYVNSRKKVCIKCPIHGMFSVAPEHHVHSRVGCQKCSGCHKYTTEEWIQEAERVHGQVLDYSLVKYTKANAMVKLRCPIHGNFELVAYQHLQRAYPCSQCYFKTQIRDSESFIVASKAKFGDKQFDYSEVKYEQSTSKIVLKCAHHGIFTTTPAKHMQTRFGCGQCANEKHPNVAMSIEEFIRICAEVHMDKYDYSMLESEFKYEALHSMVTVVCPDHGSFQQRAAKHRYGHGCPECSKYTRRYDTERFVEEAKKVHGDKYDYSKVAYSSCNQKVCIICPVHGEFEQMPYFHRVGQGCRECSLNCRYVDTEIFIKEAMEIHQGKYDYSKVEYITNKHKVCITCPLHGDFWQNAASHKKGFGCVRCTDYGVSKIANQWLEFISVTVKDLQHRSNGGEYAIPNSRYMADGYSAASNTVFEFNGDFWHGNPRKFNANAENPRTKTTFGVLYDRTIRKERFVRDQGYNYFGIWECDWKKGAQAVKLIQRQWRSRFVMTQL